MTQITNTGRAQKNLKLTIGSDTFEKHVSSIAWNPTSNQVTWQGGTPDALLVDQTPSTWVAAWTVLQDWQNPDSLINWMYDHQGEQVEVEYMPDADGDVTFTAEVTIPDVTIGGAVNAFNESQISAASTKPTKGTLEPVVPVIDSLDPATGGIAGGNEIEIHGTGFNGTTAVKFAAANAGSFLVISSTLIVATPPAHAAGNVNVTVVNPAGVSNAEPYLYA